MTTHDDTRDHKGYIQLKEGKEYDNLVNDIVNGKETIDEFLERAKNSPNPIRILVAGSRNYNDYPAFTNMMNQLIKEFPDTIFITGKAPNGPDNMIIEYSKEFGYQWEEYPADWNNIGVLGAKIKENKFGKQYNALAGFMRNETMASVSDFYIIFWDGESPGTLDMINRSEKSIRHGIVIIV